MWLQKRDCGPFLDVLLVGGGCGQAPEWQTLTDEYRASCHIRETGPSCLKFTRGRQDVGVPSRGATDSSPAWWVWSSRGRVEDRAQNRRARRRLARRCQGAARTEWTRSRSDSDFSLWSFEADSHVAATWLGNRLSSAALDGSQSLRTVTPPHNLDRVPSRCGAQSAGCPEAQARSARRAKCCDTRVWLAPPLSLSTRRS